MRVLLCRLHMQRADIGHILSLFSGKVGNRNPGNTEKKNDRACKKQ
jgi:hypothetical protein